VALVVCFQADDLVWQELLKSSNFALFRNQPKEIWLSNDAFPDIFMSTLKAAEYGRLLDERIESIDVDFGKVDKSIAGEI
jgi:hypothetical protein